MKPGIRAAARERRRLGILRAGFRSDGEDLVGAAVALVVEGLRA